MGRTRVDTATIVYAHHHERLDVLAEQLQAAGIGFARIDGKKTDVERETALGAFATDPEVRVLLGSKVLERGLNLQHARVLLSLDTSWNPSDLASDDGGKTDVVDVQFLMFNLLAMIYVVAAFLWRPESGLPALPTALAALTSVSALTYTANKAVTASGPAITGASFDPLRGTVTVTGVNLLGSRGLPSTLTFDNIDVAPPAGASSTSVTFVIPPGTQPGPHTVVVSAPTPSGGVMQAAATVATS